MFAELNGANRYSVLYRIETAKRDGVFLNDFLAEMLSAVRAGAIPEGE